MNTIDTLIWSIKFQNYESPYLINYIIINFTNNSSQSREFSSQIFHLYFCLWLVVRRELSDFLFECRHAMLTTQSKVLSDVCCVSIVAMISDSQVRGHENILLFTFIFTNLSFLLLTRSSPGHSGG